MKFRLSIRLLLVLTLFASICVAYYANLKSTNLRDKRRLQRLVASLPNSSFNFRTAEGVVNTDVRTVPEGKLYCIIADNADSGYLFEELRESPAVHSLESIAVWCARSEQCGVLGIDHSCLKRFARFTSLKSLAFFGIDMNDDQLEAISVIPVTELAVQGEGFNDASLHIIANSKSITHLDVSLTKVTDDSVDDICEMRQLIYLKCNDTDISDAGLIRMRRNFPNLHIDHPRVSYGTIPGATINGINPSPQ